MVYIQVQASSISVPTTPNGCYNHRHRCSFCIFTGSTPPNSILLLFPNYDKFPSKMTAGNPPRMRKRTWRKSSRDTSTFSSPSSSAVTGSSQQPDEVNPLTIFTIYFSLNSHFPFCCKSNARVLMIHTNCICISFCLLLLYA